MNRERKGKDTRKLGKGKGIKRHGDLCLLGPQALGLLALLLTPLLQVCTEEVRC